MPGVATCRYRVDAVDDDGVTKTQIAQGKLVGHEVAAGAYVLYEDAGVADGLFDGIDP
ncbi:hypothetical protein D3C72_2096560 [compost metagenome]